ncbi:hypothetical protein S40285_08617 [Stachybotrys chlorohalonatus IBT 40285]|uniref:Major facilitator superfamily (MFS) profile domain-containing protein n=1 Tax=Stachybotrys chlorohalonatus (strain IBT 40285) TaxID=1283841 RepID=A0A084QZB4_STAC4|nr:hypothetical protein S40285_08617 [Stachybotrys chlorohalonata IBT 40285]
MSSIEQSHNSSTAEHLSDIPPAKKAPEVGGLVASTPPPDGGLKAWLQVAGAFSVSFNTWGLLNTFGIFQTYYEGGELFQNTSSNISWIGAIQSFLVLMGGLVSGPLYDRGYLRFLMGLGSFGIVFGLMMLSLATEYWQVLLAQGFCVGLGAGLLFTPSVSVLQGYFRANIGLASGVAAAGSSLGGIIYPIVFYRLIDRIGFGWTVRTIGFIALITLLAPNVFLKQRIKPPGVRQFIDTTAFTDAPYMIFTIGCVFGFVGLYVMFFYISYYGLQTGVTDAAMAFYIVPIMNAASTFGRVLPNWLSDQTGPLNLMIPGGFICGVLVLSMQAVHTLAGEVVIAILFGFFSGVFIALPTVAFIVLTADKSRIGTRIGMGFAFFGVGTLTGGPGGGAILQQTGNGHNWTSTWVFGGVMLLASGFIFTTLRIWKSGFQLKVKT